MMGRPIQIHFALGADQNTAHLMFLEQEVKFIVTYTPSLPTNGIMITVTSQIRALLCTSLMKKKTDYHFTFIVFLCTRI